MGSRITVALVVALAALNLWQFQTAGSSDEEAIVRFQQIWASRTDTWRENVWFGIPTMQHPFDVWITQEIMWEVKPDVIVEAGTFKGGSAALWALLLREMNPDGRVITIDIANASQEARELPISKERVDFLLGSSTSPIIVEEVRKRVEGKRVLVILDSLHKAEHVIKELRAYGPMVPVGSYMIVQDSAVNGHPVLPGWGPGPYEAIEEFLAETDDFVIDHERERLMATANTHGFLKRVK